MKVKVLSRNPDDYLRETKLDIHKVPRNYDPSQHPFQEGREYTRALNATKLDKIFAKPFLGSLDGHKDGVCTLAKHPKQLSLSISGCYDGEIRIWDLPRRKSLAHVQAHHGWVRGISVDPTNGDSFLSVGDDKCIKQWGIGPDVFNSESQDLSEPVHSILSKNSLLDISHHWRRNQFVTCGEVVNVWDHHRGSPVRTFSWGVDSIQRIRWNPVETDLMAATASDRSIILYDSRGQVPIRKTVLKLRSNSLAWNPMEAYILTVANEDYNCYSFDIRNLSSPVNIHMDHTSAVMDVDYAPTGKEFVTGSYDKSIRIFPSDKGRSREVYHTKRMQRVICVSYSMDSKFIVSGSDEMNLRVWKAKAAEKLGPTIPKCCEMKCCMQFGVMLVLKAKLKEKVRPREERSFRYANKLKDKFGHHPEVKRIARHRHVPKHIFSAEKEHRIIRNSQSRKEANRRAHSKPGAVPYVPERKKHVVSEDQ